MIDFDKLAEVCWGEANGMAIFDHIKYAGLILEEAAKVCDNWDFQAQSLAKAIRNLK